MSYGFDKADTSVTLPSQVAEKPPESISLANVLQAGSALGFVARDGAMRRKTGPKRTEPQDKITIAGPRRIIDRLKAYCDQNGGLAYHAAIDVLLDNFDDRGGQV